MNAKEHRVYRRLRHGEGIEILLVAMQCIDDPGHGVHVTGQPEADPGKTNIPAGIRKGNGKLEWKWKAVPQRNASLDNGMWKYVFDDSAQL